MSEAFRQVIEESGLYFGRSTARETGQLFALMAKGELVSKEASALMVSILERQQEGSPMSRPRSPEEGSSNHIAINSA